MIMYARTNSATYMYMYKQMYVHIGIRNRHQLKANRYRVDYVCNSAFDKIVSPTDKFRFIDIHRYTYTIDIHILDTCWKLS